MNKCQFQLYLKLITLISLMVVNACTATKAYVGPDRGKSEISRVYFFSNPGIDSSHMSIDGITQGFFDMGMDVLPGSHRVDTDIQMKDMRCESYRGSFCSDIVASGTCTAKFTSEAGKCYAVRITGNASAAYISAEERKSKQIAGTGSCEITDFDLAPHRR